MTDSIILIGGEITSTTCMLTLVDREVQESSRCSQTLKSWVVTGNEGTMNDEKMSLLSVRRVRSYPATASKQG